MFNMRPRSKSSAQEAMISLPKAEQMLVSELQYSADRARFIVKQFDRNGDGKLTAKEVEKFKNSVKQTKKDLSAAFAQYDRNSDGHISMDEARIFLSQQPFNLSSKSVNALLARFDSNSDGSLDYNEFMMFYPEAKAAHDEIMQQFDHLDADGTGALPVPALIQIVRQLTGFSESQARQFLAFIDANQDGFVDRKEFTDMWSQMFA